MRSWVWAGVLGLFLGGFQMFAEGVPSSKISALYFEYKDQIQGYALEIASAEVKLSNQSLELESLIDSCEHTKALARKGHEPGVAVRACEAAVLLLQTQILQQRNTLFNLNQNREIWAMRLAAECGEPMDLTQLGQKYVTKWKEALILVDAQLVNATKVQEQAGAYLRWATGYRKRGYMTDLDYQQAQNLVQVVENEIAGFFSQRKTIQASLKDAEAALSGLARIQGADGLAPLPVEK